MRGKEDNAPLVSRYVGITPAYAGKRWYSRLFTPICWDHPRVCGEKPLAVFAFYCWIGSPPRMRGKGADGAHDVLCDGITPAYAGKSSSKRWRRIKKQDHPRVCGEKVYAYPKPCKRSGSPPRMRGKEYFQDTKQKYKRITPAYAGKSWVEGKHYWESAGSPPRMRGKVKKEDTNMPRSRITPAYAGKRLKRSRSTVPPVAIVPLFPSVCNKPVVSDGSPAGRDAPLFLPAENAVPASPAYNLRSL